MVKIAMITPINCITREKDGQKFAVLWDENGGAIVADFEDGRTEGLDYMAHSAKEASSIVYDLYMPSMAYLCDMEELDDEA